MQPEKKLNPFTPVSFQDLDDRPAQSKPKQPMPPPMMVPGQRYSGFSSSYLSKPSAIPAQREEKRLGERAGLPTRTEGGRATASPALWQNPSFAPRDGRPAASGSEGSRTASSGFAPPQWRERPQAQPVSAPSVGGFSRPGSLSAAPETLAPESGPAYRPNEWEDPAATVPGTGGYTPNEYSAGRDERLSQSPAVTSGDTSVNSRAKSPASFGVPSFAPYGEDMRNGAADDKTGADDSVSAPLTPDVLMRRWEEDRPVVPESSEETFAASHTESPASFGVPSFAPYDEGMRYGAADDKTGADDSVSAPLTPDVLMRRWEEDRPVVPESSEETFAASHTESPASFGVPSFAPYDEGMRYGAADGDGEMELAPLSEDAAAKPPEYLNYARPPLKKIPEDTRAETPASFAVPSFAPCDEDMRGETADGDGEMELAPLSEDAAAKPPEYLNYARPRRESDVSVTAGKENCTEDESAPSPAEKPDGKTPRRRSRMQRRHDAAEETESEELISAAPRTYEAKTEKAEPVHDRHTEYAPTFEQDTLPEIQEDMSYYWYGGYGLPQSPSRGSYTDVQPYGNGLAPASGGLDSFGGAPDFSAVSQSEYTDFYGQPMEPPQTSFGDEGGLDSFGGTPDFSAVSQSEYTDFYGQPMEPPQTSFGDEGGLDSFGSAPDFSAVSQSEYTDFYGQPVSPAEARTTPGSFTSPMAPVQAGDMYREYGQMARQAQAPLESSDGQTRPQPAFDPRTRQKAQPEQQPAKNARRKPTRSELVSLVSMIGIGIVLIVLLTVVTIEFGKIFSRRDQSEAVWEQYSQTHVGSPDDNPVMVALPDSGQTLPPAYTSIPDTPTPPPSVGMDGAYPEAVVQETAPATGSRTKVERYPNNHFAYISYYVEDHNINPALMGMLSIPGVLNEFVVQAQGDDPSSKYLSVNYRGGASPGGAVYIDGPADLRIPPENIILRGSDAAEGRVFQPLWQYVTDNTFYNRDAHAFARLTTLYEEAYYVLIAAIVADVSSEKPDYFDFAGKHTFQTNNLMMAYVNNAKEDSIRDINVEVLPNDRLMTLATVSTHRDGKCLILIYRMVRDGEMHNVPIGAFPTPTPTPVPSETPVPEE